LARVCTLGPWFGVHHRARLNDAALRTPVMLLADPAHVPQLQRSAAVRCMGSRKLGHAAPSAFSLLVFVASWEWTWAVDLGSLAEAGEEFEGGTGIRPSLRGKGMYSAVQQLPPQYFFPFGCCNVGARPVTTTTTTAAAVTVPQIPAFAPNEPGGPYYFLQWAGLQTSGISRPRSPLDPDASLCLTAGTQDTLDGISLYWHTCQIDEITPTINVAVRDAQAFSLADTGQIRSKATQFCIRRMQCKESFVYDLGPCDGPGQIPEFWVQKPVANNLDHLRPMGYPAQAVATDACKLCGPYLLLERCRSHGGPSQGAGGCGQHWQAKLGWTKMPTQYVGDATAEGRLADGFSRDFIGELTSAFRTKEADISGLGGSNDHDMCASYVTDGPTLESAFYFHKMR